MAIRKIISATVDIARAVAFETSNNRILTEADRGAFRADGLLLYFDFVYSLDDGTTWAEYVIPADATLKFAMKDPAALSGANFLAFSDNEKWNVAGDRSDADRAHGKCCVRVSTGTANMETFLNATAAAGLTVVEEVEMQMPGEDPVTLLHGSFQMKPDAIRGTEGDPAPTTPTYALTTDVNNALAQYFERDADGGLWVKIDGIRVHKFDKP